MDFNPIAAMATWVGALARGGLLIGHTEEEGAMLAHRVLGDDELTRLRTWFAAQPPQVVERERRGAIHACIWMAHADREVAPEEVALLEEVIRHSDLSPEAQAELGKAIQAPLDPAAIAEELTQHGLRELVLALTWELAKIDDRFDDDERAAHHDLAEAFGVSDARAREIEALVTA